MKPLAILLLLTTLLVVGACDTQGEIICTLEARPGLAIEVREAATGAPAVEGTFAFLLDGEYTETLEGPPIGLGTDPPTLYGAYERAGTYHISVVKVGFKTWQARDVKVDADECHVKTVRLEAQLEAK